MDVRKAFEKWALTQGWTDLARYPLTDPGGAHLHGKYRTSMLETMWQVFSACSELYESGLRPAGVDIDREQRLDHLKALDPKELLFELLAVIHGDGGHYALDHGLPRAVADAELIYYHLRQIAIEGTSRHEAREKVMMDAVRRFASIGDPADYSVRPKRLDVPFEWCENALAILTKLNEETEGGNA